MQAVRIEVIKEIPITFQMNVLSMITAKEMEYNDKLITEFLKRSVQ